MTTDNKNSLYFRVLEFIESNPGCTWSDLIDLTTETECDMLRCEIKKLFFNSRIHVILDRDGNQHYFTF